MAALEVFANQPSTTVASGGTAAAEDGTVHAFHGRVYEDLATPPLIVPLKVLRGHAVVRHEGVAAMAWHPTQPWCVTAGADGTVRVWDLRMGTVALAFPSGSPIWCTATVPGHGAGSPVLNADGTVRSPPAPLGDVLLLSGHEDGVVRKWDSRMPLQPMQLLTGHSGAVVTLAADGDRVVTGSVDSTVRLWDAPSGASVRCDGHWGQVAATAI